VADDLAPGDTAAIFYTSGTTGQGDALPRRRRRKAGAAGA
jgi:acyl-coenzyme A synthetase/AMP-(fatty) acid ligase